MKKHIVKAFIRWITAVTNMLAYQSNIFPQEHLQELVGASVDLIESLEGEM